jgi:hypothetical protein
LGIFLNDFPPTVNIDSFFLNNTAFGGIYSNIPQSFNFAGAGQLEQIQLPNFMPSFDIGVNPSSLQIFRPGEYEINYMIRIAPVSAAGQTVSAGVLQNGGFIDSTMQLAQLSTTDTTILQGSVIEFLGGQVELAFLSTDTAEFELSQLTNATLTVERLSPLP